MPVWGDLLGTTWGNPFPANKGMTLSDLKDKVYRATGNKYTDFIYIRHLLNDAISDLTDEAKLEDKAVIPITTGKNEYPLPTNFKSPRSLMNEVAQLNYPLIDIAEDKFGYALYNGSLIMKPMPQEQVDLTLYYHKYASNLVNDTDIPDIDPHYHNLLAAYAITHVLAQIPDSPKWIVEKYDAQWNNGKRQFTAEMQKKRKLKTVKETIQW